MQTLEPVRAWSRACHLVIEHYHTAKSCQDPMLRAEIVTALLALPVSLAEGTNASQPEKFIDAMAAARTCCAKIKTHLYIARELRVIETIASDKFLVESIDMSELLTRSQWMPVSDPRNCAAENPS